MPSARRGILAATIIGSSLTFVDATAVNVALPALQNGLHATMTEVQWVIEGYALFLGALILVGGSVGDQIGRRKVFLTGVALFTAASIGCGVAGSANALIAGRALQGIGAAFLVPGSLAIISAAFADAERGRAIGAWSGFTSITSAAGPVIGGWLIDHVGWRAVFFLNVPLAAAVFALTLAYVPESRDPSRSRQIDWTGAALATLGLGLVVFALLEWPRSGARSPLVAGSLVAGLIGLAAFLAVERASRNPMLPLNVFASRTFTLTNVLTLLLYATLGITFFLVPMNLILVQGYPATAAGAALLPMPIIMFALSRWSGGLVARIGSRLPLTVGPIVAAAGTALFARPHVGALVLDDLFSGHRAPRRRHGADRRAADDDGDGGGRARARRRGLRDQQRSGPRRGSAGDRGVRGGAGRRVSHTRRRRARPARPAARGARHDRSGAASNGRCRSDVRAVDRRAACIRPTRGDRRVCRRLPAGDAVCRGPGTVGRRGWRGATVPHIRRTQLACSVVQTSRCDRVHVRTGPQRHRATERDATLDSTARRVAARSAEADRLEMSRTRIYSDSFPGDSLRPTERPAMQAAAVESLIACVTKKKSAATQAAAVERLFVPGDPRFVVDYRRIAPAFLCVSVSLCLCGPVRT